MEGRKRSQWESSMTQEEKAEREGRERRTEGDLEKSLLHFFFLLKKIFIYLIGCTGSELQHAGSLLWCTDSLAGVCKLSSCGPLT